MLSHIRVQGPLLGVHAGEGGSQLLVAHVQRPRCGLDLRGLLRQLLHAPRYLLRRFCKDIFVLLGGEVGSSAVLPQAVLLFFHHVQPPLHPHLLLVARALALNQPRLPPLHLTLSTPNLSQRFILRQLKGGEVRDGIAHLRATRLELAEGGRGLLHLLHASPHLLFLAAHGLLARTQRLAHGVEGLALPRQLVRLRLDVASNLPYLVLVLAQKPVLPLLHLTHGSNHLLFAPLDSLHPLAHTRLLLAQRLASRLQLVVPLPS